MHSNYHLYSVTLDLYGCDPKDCGFDSHLGQAYFLACPVDRLSNVRIHKHQIALILSFVFVYRRLALFKCQRVINLSCSLPYEY